MRHLWLLLVALVSVITSPACSETVDLQRYLRNQYQGKTLLLRGFYSGENLLYDSSGDLANPENSGDWTANGFVGLNEIHASGNRISIDAQRLVAIMSDGMFQLRPAQRMVSDTERGAAVVAIEIDLGSNPSLEQAKSALSKIFLGSQDSLSDLVPNYWKPCVSRGLRGESRSCVFSTEVLGVPGVAFFPENNPTSSSPPAAPESSNASEASTDSTQQSVFRAGTGVTPPRALYSPEPEFSQFARAMKYQGKVTLQLVVRKDGRPTNIQVLIPVGCGLDVRAVGAVRTWKFRPAEKDGQPVSVVIAIEVDFHLQ
jgi:TonB family protein